MKKLIIILAAAAMTGCGIYKPYTRPEVKTDGLYGTAETADTDRKSTRLNSSHPK